MVSFRPISKPDTTGICRVITYAFSQAATASNCSTEQIQSYLSQFDASRSSVEEVFKTLHGSGFSEVAVHENTIVGFARARKKGESVKVSVLFVDPAYQHKHIGTKLLEHVTVFAHQEKATKLTCNSILSAKAFYEKHGFVSTVNKPTLHQNIPVYPMCKHL